MISCIYKLHKLIGHHKIIMNTVILTIISNNKGKRIRVLVLKFYDCNL